MLSIGGNHMKEPITIGDILNGCNCALVDLAGQRQRILNVYCPVHSQEKPPESTLTPEQLQRLHNLFNEHN
jgi:hypothetical protein